MTDLSNVKARLHRLPLRTIIAHDMAINTVHGNQRLSI